MNPTFPLRKSLPFVLVLLLLPVGAAAAEQPGVSGPGTLVMPEVIRAPFTGDLPLIRERGVLRALVTPNRTDFFLEGARPRGIMVELLEAYVKTLNQGLKRRDLHVVVKYVIVPFKDLIPALLAGRGDIVVTTMTITPDREARVSFARGKENNVDELLVAHKDVEGIATLDDIAGRTVHVVAGSTHAEHLRELSDRLVADGKPPIKIEEVDPRLATEDILEMTNAGVVEITVADDFRAELWARVLPDIVVHDEVKVHSGATLGWAVRRENPELLQSVRSAATDLRSGTAVGNILMRRYFQNTRWITNPVSETERKKLEHLVGLFKRYGDQYGFDWLALVAQGYQESGLDQSVRSPAGAVGIMQLLPSTASDSAVGIPDLHTEENNIHAGAKYLAFLRRRYFDDPGLAEEDRLAFSWAAYNAGPAKVKRMRTKTAELGLDPNRWFGNVEHGALAVVGQETVRYVRNIYKYYIT